MAGGGEGKSFTGLRKGLSVDFDTKDCVCLYRKCGGFLIDDAVDHT